jgi:hypothetical protein
MQIRRHRWNSLSSGLDHATFGMNQDTAVPISPASGAKTGLSRLRSIYISYILCAGDNGHEQSPRLSVWK